MTNSLKAASLPSVLSQMQTCGSGRVDVRHVLDQSIALEYIVLGDAQLIDIILPLVTVVKK
jgi:hypothetical protein